MFNGHEHVVGTLTMVTQEHSTESKKWPQYMAASIAALSTVSAALAVGWSSPALPYLEDLGSSDNASWDNASSESSSSQLLSVEESSFISSFLPLGALVGSLPAGMLCEKFGRRGTLQIANAFLIVGWILLCSVQRSVIVLFVARFLHGITLGLNCVAVPLYNEEIAQVDVRGAIGVLYNGSITFGILLVYVFGTVTSYFWMNVSCTIVSVAAIIGILFIPESPIYFLKRLRIEKAEKSLKCLRKAKDTYKYDISLELQMLQKIVDSANERSEKSSAKIISFKIRNFSCKYLRTTTAKSFHIIMSLMVLRQFGGINAIGYNLVRIFQESGSDISPYVSATIISAIEVSFAFVSFTGMDRLGRRLFLLVSSSMMAISLFALAAYFYLKRLDYDLSNVSWLPILCVGVIYPMFSIGLGSTPFLMMAEIVPTESKWWVTGVCSMTNWLCCFVSVEVFPLMVRDIGSEWTYMFFCIVNITGFVIIIFIIPETKNKSIETIHEELSKMRIICK